MDNFAEGLGKLLKVPFWIKCLLFVFVFFGFALVVLSLPVTLILVFYYGVRWVNERFSSEDNDLELMEDRYEVLRLKYDRLKEDKDFERKRMELYEEFR